MAKFLSEQGLVTLWAKIKAHVTSAVNAAKTAVGNYTVNGKKISTNPTLGKADVGLGNVTNDAQVKRSEMGVASGVATLGTDGKLPAAQMPKVNASNITGTIPLANLPQGALERLVVVADDTARLALTSSQVQKGDTVKVQSTGEMYFVVDDTKLSQEAGYEVYAAGSAAHADNADYATEAGKVAWNNVQGKPSTFAPAAHNQASNTINAMTGYAKASAAGAISATDSLNTAVGKLEKKLDDVTSQGGEPNVIEGVKVNGTALTVAADKTVTIPKASDTTVGVAKLYINLTEGATDGAVTPKYMEEYVSDNVQTINSSLGTKLDKTDVQALTDAEIDAIIAG